jgi:transcriptional regulator with XRE-family HTH domain
MDDPWKAQLEALGAFIRSQRQLANLSLRELAEVTSLSNAYLSQIERGLHQPSVRVLKAVASALDVSAEALLAQAGLLEAREPAADPPPGTTEAAIRADTSLSESQKEAMLSVYRSFRPPDEA